MCEVRCNGEKRYGSTSTAALLQGNSRWRSVGDVTVQAALRHDPRAEARPRYRGQGKKQQGAPGLSPAERLRRAAHPGLGAAAPGSVPAPPVAERAGPGAALRRRARPRAVPTSLLSATGTHLNIRREVSPTVTHFFSLRGHSR